MLVSFDIDGTLEVGDPRGPISLDVVRAIVDRGHRVGSASDWTLAEQREMWRVHGIDVDFVSHKHNLQSVRDSFDCVDFVHVGDTDTDRWYAGIAGFRYCDTAEVAKGFPSRIAR